MKPSDIDGYYVGHEILFNGKWYRVSEYTGKIQMATVGGGHTIMFKTVDRIGHFFPRMGGRVSYTGRMWEING